MAETARELIGKARSYRCSDQPCRCPACELARRVERVLEAHVPLGTIGSEGAYCRECMTRWPCPTLRALDGAE